MTRNVGLSCAALGCVKPAKTRGMCKTHYNKATGHYIGNWTKDPERERARLRIKTHRRKDWSRLTDITPEYEMALRAKATRCPMPGCGVRLIDEPYLPASKELDHIVPRAVGGTHTIGNVRVICRACNVRRPDDGSDYTGPVTWFGGGGVMAGRGPAPKDPAKRVRRNADPVPTTTVAADDTLRGPELPADALEEPWHPRTLAWWETWRRSPQAQTFTATDWDFLLDTALMHHTMWLKGRWEFASELRLRAAKFGATPEDRARLRMQVTVEAPKPEGEKPAGRYAHLRSVKSA